MLRMIGKSLKEQEAIIKKNPELILTTGRPVDLTKAAVAPRAKHPGLKSAKPVAKTKEKADAKKAE